MTRKEIMEKVKKKKDKVRYDGNMPPFVMCLKGMVYHGGQISPGAFNCWMALKNYVSCWDEQGNYEAVFPGRTTLGIMMGKHPSQVTKYFAELRKVGMLKSYKVDQTWYHFLYDPPKSWEMECRKKIKKAQEKREQEKIEKYREVSVLPGRTNSI